MDDPCAKAICEKASNELVKLVLPVAKKLTLEEGKLSLLGGILTHYGPIKNMVIERLANELPALQIVEPMYDSATGAAIIARHHYLKSIKGGS